MEPAAGSRPAQSAGSGVRDLVRDEVVLSAKTWVVKVGTSVLTGPDGALDPARIDHLAEQICQLIDGGRKVALVSSAQSARAWASWDGRNGPTTCDSSRPRLPSDKLI